MALRDKYKKKCTKDINKAVEKTKNIHNKDNLNEINNERKNNNLL